jgi:hypothetical protein
MNYTNTFHELGEGLRAGGRDGQGKFVDCNPIGHSQPVDATVGGLSREQLPQQHAIAGKQGFPELGRLGTSCPRDASQAHGAAPPAWLAQQVQHTPPQMAQHPSWKAQFPLPRALGVAETLHKAALCASIRTGKRLAPQSLPTLSQKHTFNWLFGTGLPSTFCIFFKGTSGGPLQPMEGSLFVLEESGERGRKNRGPCSTAFSPVAALWHPNPGLWPHL